MSKQDSSSAARAGKHDQRRAERSEIRALSNAILTPRPAVWVMRFGQSLRDGRPVCVIDPKGGLKSSSSGKEAGFPVIIFVGNHFDIPLTADAGAHVAEFVATGKPPCIVDLGGWTIGDRTRFFVDLASTLFRHTRAPALRRSR